MSEVVRIEDGRPHLAADVFTLDCGLEVVLSDGSLLRTAATRTARAHRQDLGPSLTGLFSQSALGAVTEMAIRLAPRPEGARSWYLTFPDASLAAVIDRLRPLRARGALAGNVHLFSLPLGPNGAPVWIGAGMLEALPGAVEPARAAV